MHREKKNIMKNVSSRKNVEIYVQQLKKRDLEKITTAC